ncbi:glycosyltransferase family 2 protein [Pseudohalocynthiibacter aestuariivivens]|uniref:Glycosyltransferase family 2 protein n=1 Tax=Pseudohalocynthiibacter aestuariivivens TaxID=1591409 RepID=A0ABV5JGW5_9RHOB|nr:MULTISPECIES: glycosyltransferase family 2 protein [Pseudohalocynthiibacter]MBS9718191.1 glycosyltransferase family 2 protein [Pseudohalocynthiibacter aestuariivivens]MCK0103841.1 glycosyltransferase family 2 protein [Pseudohalocynthiibacter sp. F2068]
MNAISIVPFRKDNKPAPDKTGARSVTLIVPVYNEEGSIQAFLDTVTPVLEGIRSQVRFEILFVNDGSRDATERLIMSAAAERGDIGLLNLSRNFGKEAALFAGLCHAEGAAVIPLDVDLQDPPEVISEMIARWLAGAKVVNARRARRDGDSRFKNLTANAFYRVFNAMAEQPIPRDVGDFRLFDREVVSAICQLGERSRFNKALFSWVGFEAEEVTFKRPARAAGETCWSYWKLWKLALDGIFASSTVPLRIWTYIGMVLALASLAYSAFMFARVLFFGVDVPGYASTLILILVFGGMNMFALGIIGEYVGRIYTEVRQRPVYIIRSHHRCSDKED